METTLSTGEETFHWGGGEVTSSPHDGVPWLQVQTKEEKEEGDSLLSSSGSRNIDSQLWELLASCQHDWRGNSSKPCYLVDPLVLVVAGCLLLTAPPGLTSILRPKVSCWPGLGLAVPGWVSDVARPGGEGEGGDDWLGGVDPLHPGAGTRPPGPGLVGVHQWAEQQPPTSGPTALLLTRTGEQLCHLLLISGIITIFNIVI